MLMALSSSDTPFQVSASSTSVYLISLHGALISGLKIKVTSLNPSTGQKIDTYSLSSDSDISNADQILYVGANTASPLIAWTDKGHKTLKINIIGSKNIHSLAIDNASGNEIEQVILHAPQHPTSLSHFLVHYQTATEHWAEVYHINLATSAVSKAYSLPKLAGKGAFTSSSIDANVFFTRVTTSEMVLVSSASHGILARWDLKQTKSLTPVDLHPVQITAEVVASSGSSYPIRAAVLSSLGDWSLIRNGVESWSRPEYLTGALTAVFVDQPEEQSLARELEIEGHQNVVAAFAHRFKRHLSDLQNLPGALQSLQETLTGSSTTSSGKDKFGFRKLVVIALESGRVAGLEASSGNTIWNTDVAGLAEGSNWDVPELRSTPDGVVEVWEQSTTQPYLINATDGRIIAQPDSKSAGQSSSRYPPIAGSGYAFDQSDRGVRAFLPADPSSTLWQFTAPLDQRIVSVAVRPADDPVSSIGRVLGDRRVLYKYLNPNLALISVVDDATGNLTVTLVDTVSGSYLYKTSHSGVDTSKAIVAAVSENWFAYSFTAHTTASDSSRGHEIVISDLYESSLPNDRGPLGSSSNYSSIGCSPLELSTPYVVSQTYHIPEEIVHMSVTHTRQGITSRALLVTLAESNGIVAIPRQILDPRRPIGRDPTSDEVAEGLMRYTPTLEIDPKWYLNHQREVIGVKDVITSPSLLESTSLVFAYGLDIFGTRVSPSFTFDILGKGFNKVQMLLTVAALGVAVVFVAPFVSHLHAECRPVVRPS